MLCGGESDIITFDASAKGSYFPHLIYIGNCAILIKIRSFINEKEYRQNR